MKTNTILLRVTLLAGLFSCYSCRPAKEHKANSSVAKQETKTTDPCNQVVRYYANKLRSGNNGPEADANTEIVINPVTQRILLTSELPGQKVTFETVIESSDCQLNASLTEGKSIYKGYIKQDDGSTTQQTVIVEAQNGSITISGGNNQTAQSMIIPVTRWEVVKE